MILDSRSIPVEQKPSGDLALAGKEKDFYLPDLEECKDMVAEWRKSEKIGPEVELALFIYNYQPAAGVDAELWRAQFQRAANYIAQAAIESLM